MRKLTRMIAVGALAAAMLAGTAPASHAGDCVSAEVYTEDSSGNKDYIIGPKSCVVWTPWEESFSVWSNPGPVGFEIWFTRPSLPPPPA